jgi:DNA mismatch repair protein MutL
MYEGRNLSQAEIYKPVCEKIATMACKAAIKGNMAITEDEFKALIVEMFKLENPYNCPHGRPTTISMSKYEIEKKFKRIV